MDPGAREPMMIQLQDDGAAVDVKAQEEPDDTAPGGKAIQLKAGYEMLAELRSREAKCGHPIQTEPAADRRSWAHPRDSITRGRR